MATFPGSYAVPGAMWPGAIWPGAVISAAALSGHLYQGTETLVYIDYIDISTGHTLVAAPGGSYQIAPAGQGFNYGFAIPPPDGLWAN